MNVIQEITDLRVIRREWQLAGKKIGFVPTMGNLHEGHLSLVKEAQKECDIIVVSIFVNPLQFGPGEDLDAYPKTIEEDKAKLAALGVDLLFLPHASDIYPRGLENQTFVEVPGISYMICGASRPGHFRGVATIVCKLFNMVQPNHAYFGEKDYQQLQVIKAMVTDLSMNLHVHGVPTVREKDGLAMSSRNGYLTESERETASQLYQIMQQLEEQLKLGRRDYKNLTRETAAKINQAGFKTDYVEIRDQRELQHPTSEESELIILAAAFLGKARLIDNLQVNL